MAKFDIAYKLTSANEGGYVNDPNDSGGETYCGISRKNFPRWKGWTVVDANKPLKKGAKIAALDSLEKEFYKINFWIPINGDSISDQDLANQVYDMAVNAGVKAALKLLA